MSPNFAFLSFVEVGLEKKEWGLCFFWDERNGYQLLDMRISHGAKLFFT